MSDTTDLRRQALCVKCGFNQADLIHDPTVHGPKPWHEFSPNPALPELLEANIDSNDRLAEGLVRGVQEMGASQAKLPVHIDGETWDVTVRFRGAQPDEEKEAQDIPQCMLCGKPSPVGDPCERCKDNAVLCVTCQEPATHYGHSNVRTPFTHKFVAANSRGGAQPDSQFEAWVIKAARQILAEIALEKPRLRTSRIAEIIQAARGGAQPEPDPLVRAAQKVIDELDNGYPGHDQYSCDVQYGTLEELRTALRARAGVTGNEGKDGNGNGDNLHPANSPDDTAGPHHRQTESSLASPAVVTPPEGFEPTVEWWQKQYNALLEFGNVWRAEAKAKVSGLEAQLQQAQVLIDKYVPVIRGS